jgi:hypothetical protein
MEMVPNLAHLLDTLNIGGDNRKELEHQTRHQDKVEFWHFGGPNYEV